jgi:hypothetical protein
MSFETAIGIQHLSLRGSKSFLGGIQASLSLSPAAALGHGHDRLLPGFPALPLSRGRGGMARAALASTECLCVSPTGSSVGL